MNQELFDQLVGISGVDQVFSSAEDVAGYLYDSTEEYVRPAACTDCYVIRPGTYEEVSAVMKLANETKTPVVVRGGGTGACGAAIPTVPSIIMSMERFRDILEVDETSMMVTCQAGVSLAKLNEYLDEHVHSLYFPCHPGDEGAHVGGMAIENAGGVRAVKHGIMRNYVKGLKVVLPSGEIVQFGGKLVKNNMGYDIMHLLVGSEGTLAIILEATLKLYPRMDHTGTLVCSYLDTESAIASVAAVQRKGIIPLAVEYMDRMIALKTAEEISKTWPMHDEGKVDLIFMVEEATEDALYETAGTIAEICEEAGAVNSVIAENAKDQRDVLEVRSMIYEIFLPYFVDSLDTAVPMAHIGDLLRDIDAIAEKYHTTSPRVGHVADGNFHNFIMREDGKPPVWADDMRRDIYEAALKYGGTVTAEHGTGKTRKPYMNLQFTPGVIEVMKGIKRAFDPNNILNPGVILDL
ncbi:MAG: FAD-binding oxidoreductase [Oscillospiraceae bacterium]|nr:FAD-binding oxidoreductase [Oscillospiraceae bacterium]